MEIAIEAGELCTFCYQIDRFVSSWTFCDKETERNGTERPTITVSLAWPGQELLSI
jgi:hypothetical protein